MNDQFLIEEYKSLRAEILATQKARRDYEVFGAGLIAGLYGWLSSVPLSTGGSLVFVGWWVAPVIAGGVAVRTKTLSDGVRGAGKYLKSVERKLIGAEDPTLGWHLALGRARALYTQKTDTNGGTVKSTVPEVVKGLTDMGYDPALASDLAERLDAVKTETWITWAIVSVVTGAIALAATLNF